MSESIDTLLARGSTASVLSEVRRCTICSASLPLGPNPVLQVDPRARVLIAGQAPGRRVHESGIPFADASGDRLREWMQVSRQTFYDAKRIAILPMGFCYPGTGRSGDLPPRPECAATWRRALLARMPRIELTLVLGRHALDYHLPRPARERSSAGRPRARSLTALVRDWRTHWPDLLPLPHPSPRNNRWLARNPWFEREILPVLRARLAELL